MRVAVGQDPAVRAVGPLDMLRSHPSRTHDASHPAGELDDLLTRLQRLADAAGGAPLMTVTESGCGCDDGSSASGGGAQAAAAAASRGAAGDGKTGGDEWEFV
jgi:hypothetical protein